MMTVVTQIDRLVSSCPSESRRSLLHLTPMNSLNTLALAAGIGALAGLRTFTPPAVVSHAARRSLVPLRRSRLRFLRSSGAANTIAALAIGELVADKLPSMPSRLEAGALTARAASGAVCGAAIASARRSSGKTIAAGAVLGGLAALAGACTGYHVRRQLSLKLNVPDPAVAVVEDILAIGASAAIVSRCAALSSIANSWQVLTIKTRHA
jgi:uncharacterized membrane protein